MLATRNGFARTVMILVSGTSTLLATGAHPSARASVVAADPSSCLVLEWMDPHQLLPAGERWLAKEASRILHDAKIPSRWDWSRGHARGASSSAREHRLRVVLVPSEPSGPGWDLASNTLGVTVLDGKQTSPAVYIFYHSIVSVLGRDASKRGRAPNLSDPRFLGPASRALGRVVAHEIAHAIAPGEPHARSGLMQAGLAPKLLTAKREVTIDDQWELVLGAGLSKLCAER